MTSVTLPDFETMWRDLAPIGRLASTGGYHRQPWTRTEEELRAWFAEQAVARHLTVEEDPFGNLVAWWRPTTARRDDAVLTGSHLDSVVDGGAYDGPLGVVSAFAAIDRLQAEGLTPSRPLGVAVFAEEEGSRFGRACLGSRLATGVTTWARARELRDADGIALADVVPGDDADTGANGGGDGAWRGWLSAVGCYLELHVEQGRGLVEHDAAVGVADRIWPHGRWRFDFTGCADHAGSTRMTDRADPMLGYATTALAADEQARRAEQRATFARLDVHPNSTNAIASRVTAWLDARAPSATALQELVATIEQQGTARAARDGTALAVTAESVSEDVVFPAALRDRVGAGLPVLASQAGHDAGILQAAGIDAAMLFVRNPTGVSHAPEEHAHLADCFAGVDALTDALRELLR